MSGTSVGLMMRLICSMDCRSGERPAGHIDFQLQTLIGRHVSKKIQLVEKVRRLASESETNVNILYYTKL